MNLAKAVLLVYVGANFALGYRRQVKAGALDHPSTVTGVVLGSLAYVGLAYAVVVA